MHSVGCESIKILATTSLGHVLFLFPFHDVPNQPWLQSPRRREWKWGDMDTAGSIVFGDCSFLGAQLSISGMTFYIPLLGDPQNVCHNIAVLWQNTEIPLEKRQLKYSMFYLFSKSPLFLQFCPTDPTILSPLRCF